MVEVQQNGNRPMEKQICCNNILTIEGYVRYILGKTPYEKLFQGIVNNEEFLAIDEKSGQYVPLDRNYLLNPYNWISSKPMAILYQNTKNILNDPDATYKAGRRIFSTTIGTRLVMMRLAGAKTIINRIPQENEKFNRKKRIEIVKNSHGYAIVRLYWDSDPFLNKDFCDFNRGVYEGLGTLTRNPVTVEEKGCSFKGGEFCEYHIKWKSKPFFSRFLDLVRLWGSKQIIDELEQKIEEINNVRINQDRIIELRTQDLKQAQAQLLKSEKSTLEHRITGGFAHEMRNALAGAQLEFKTTLNYKDQGKPSAEILKESATKLLKNIAELHSEFKIPRERIATLLLPELKTIAEIADHLGVVISDVSSDLDRGLSITTQIRNYAKMSEIKPGEEAIDIGRLLRTYEDRYRQDFERIGITYAVEGLEEAVIKADETHINSIFSNLILNAKDALEEVETEQAKEIKVTVEKRDDETGDVFVITAADNGPGIPEESLNEIFEPFYSTKPTTGTGLGLGIVKRLVNLYDGEIQVESEVDKGTVFKIILPVA
jgi:signal transduction histidine kinase